jgi:hypothetical protein
MLKKENIDLECLARYLTILTLDDSNANDFVELMNQIEIP